VERAIHFALLALCVLLIAVLAVTVIGDDDESAKTTLLEQVDSDLGDLSVPPEYGECLLRDLDRRLEAAQIERSERIPKQARRESALACARRLVAAGEFTPRQMMRLGRRIVPLGF